MKKLIFIIALMAFSSSADAGFETRSEVLDKKRAKKAAEEAREELQAEQTKRAADQAVRNTGLLIDQNEKLDRLIEETQRSNELMQELLNRLQ